MAAMTREDVLIAMRVGRSLTRADLTRADLTRADLTDAYLRGAYLSGANLSGADLSGANLSGANLSGANLSGAYLRGAYLSGANLSGADLSGANLSGANLRGANLSGANLTDADLTRADLTRANLSGANLRGANLSGANLSGATGLIDPAEWLRSNFSTTAEGLLVFKAIAWTSYNHPAHWTIEPGAVLSEVCNPCRTADCACGVNFGTRAWCAANYPRSELWECRIAWMDLAGVVVPYSTDGKARCARLTLLRKIKEAGADG